MNGNFGTSLQDLIMEPLTEQTKNAIIQEINTVIKSDPRITPRSILVDEYQYGLQVEMSITYSNNNQTENLLIRFNRTDGTVL
jgi:phage baseplate assembly protein W